VYWALEYTIVNQNALDLFCSFFLVITYAVKLCNIRPSGAPGYWLCMTITGELFVSLAMNGSIVNIAALTIERYLKVVHSVWSKKKLQSWMLYSATAFAWIAGIATTAPLVFATSGVINGVCYTYALFESDEMRMALTIWYILSFYFIVIMIFIFCYGRILVAIRRQARVMAAHSILTVLALHLCP